MSKIENNVRAFPGDLSPDALLEMAKFWNLDQAIVIGWDKDGEFCIGGTHTELSEISWLLKNATNWLDNKMYHTRDEEYL